ncbi:MAG: hypothetical protein AAF125_15020 [Chloroflexota bacterium]
MMFQNLHSQDLFPNAAEKDIIFPPRIRLLVHSRAYTADVDVVIGSYNQAEETNLVVQNYLAMETQARIHVWIVVMSHNPIEFMRINAGEQVSKAFLLNFPKPLNSSFYPRFSSSIGAALSAQVGHTLGKAPHLFFSHTDMMATRKDFLSFLHSKLRADRPIAAFTQRHFIPFSGGILYRKSYFEGAAVDWLPSQHNPYNFVGKAALAPRVEQLQWIDAGEELIYHTLQERGRVYVCASRGASGDFFGHPVEHYDYLDDITEAEYQQHLQSIDYAAIQTTREAFAARYPHLTDQHNEMWRKSFDDSGRLMYIHRGRGTLGLAKTPARGDFTAFMRDRSHWE